MIVNSLAWIIEALNSMIWHSEVTEWIFIICEFVFVIMIIFSSVKMYINKK